MTISRSPLAALGAAMLALSLAACGQAHAVLVTGRVLPPQQGMHDAAANLAAVRLPAGAQRIARLPASLTGVAAQAPQVLGQIDDSQYWTARGTAQAVLSGIRARLPRSFALATSGTVGGLYMMPLAGGPHPAITMRSLTLAFPVVSYDGFTLPAVTGLTERAVFVSVAPMASGRVLIRLDAQDSWPMRRTAASQVPDTVTSVTITATSAGPMIASNEVTVSSPERVRRIIALVNGLALRATGVGFHCPVRFAVQYHLVFRNRAGAEVATVGLTPSSCDVLGLQPGSGAPALLSGAHAFLAGLATITRLPTGRGYGPAPQ